MAVLNSHARLWTVLLTTLLLGTAAGNDPRPPRPAFSEYQIKAVFLFNFAQFVEWPENAFAATNSPIVIGVLGTDPFGAALPQAVAGESIGGRPLEVRRGRTLAELGRCHLLFICRSEQERLPRLLRELRGTGVLTVGETEAFARAGGVVSFLMEGNKVRFAVDPEAAVAEGLRVSAKLLKVARLVRNGVVQEDR
jgi:hypothetical protein